VHEFVRTANIYNRTKEFKQISDKLPNNLFTLTMSFSDPCIVYTEWTKSSQCWFWWQLSYFSRYYYFLFGWPYCYFRLSMVIRIIVFELHLVDFPRLAVVKRHMCRFPLNRLWLCGTFTSNRIGCALKEKANPHFAETFYLEMYFFILNTSGEIGRFDR